MARLLAWCLYDWAYSAFTTTISTFVFATYFVRSVAGDAASGTAGWAGAQTVAGLLVAALAVPVGVLADRGGRRAILGGFAAIMVIATALLWTVLPERAAIPRALSLVVVATVAFELASIVYNAMLPDVASPARLGRVSGLAWGFGYVGGLCCLLLCLYGLIEPNPPPFGLDRATAEPVRATALVAAGWITLFGWPVVVFGPRSRPRGDITRPWRAAVGEAARGLAATVRLAVQDRVIGRFLLARMIYTDGLTTLFAFGGIYAAGTFGMGARDVLLLGIALNVAAGAGAIAAALVEDRVGARRTVLVSLACLVVIGAATLLTLDRSTFFWLACGLGLFIGPAQASSRALMARLAPPERRAGLFGLFALSGRVTGFAGPAALGAATAAFADQRAGMAVVLGFLALGGLLLLRVGSPAADG